MKNNNDLLFLCEWLKIRLGLLEDTRSYMPDY